jgi:hypothetical protein
MINDDKLLKVVLNGVGRRGTVWNVVGRCGTVWNGEGR